MTAADALREFDRRIVDTVLKYGKGGQACWPCFTLDEARAISKAWHLKLNEPTPTDTEAPK